MLCHWRSFKVELCTNAFGGTGFFSYLSAESTCFAPRLVAQNQGGMAHLELAGDVACKRHCRGSSLVVRVVVVRVVLVGWVATVSVLVVGWDKDRGNQRGGGFNGSMGNVGPLEVANQSLQSPQKWPHLFGVFQVQSLLAIQKINRARF
jgi:hypothetical protein